MALRVETDEQRDVRYLAILLRAIRVCATYRPKFGKGGATGLTVDQFRALYGADPFYTWMGLDSPLLYAAHRAAGGMTSIYRQIGLGCELVIRQILQDQFGLDAEQATWVYEVPTLDGGTRKLALDGRIEIDEIRDLAARQRVMEWLQEAREHAGVAPNANIVGTVFETRQGYKSKDAKRQNADIANAGAAYATAYLPALVMLSTQLDTDLAVRYRAARWLILIGTTDGTAFDSTYVFAREVLGYDLAGFFDRNSACIRNEIEATISTLLSPE